LVKHNGPLIDDTGAGRDGPVPMPILDYDSVQDLQLSRFASLEAQVAAIADDIAYNTHDIDDGLRAGLLRVEMLQDVPFLDGLLRDVNDSYPGLEQSRLIHEIMRRQITDMVEDVIATAQAGLRRLKPGSSDDIRQAGETIARFSPALAQADHTIKAFLYKNFYRHADVMRVREKAARLVEDLYRAYLAQPTLMGGQWGGGTEALDSTGLARRVADYLAGMTDNYAIQQHRALFDRTPELR